jgi:CRP/FNR family cyclic AMP-dependent transcriptional regulator
VARATSSRNAAAGLLKTIPLFSACSKKELQRIASIAKEVHFEASRTITQEGDLGIGLHVIIEGEVKVQIGGRTRRRLGPGAFFGEIALLDGGPRTATIVAETPVTTLGIPAWDFKGILNSDSHLAIKMLEETCRRLRSSDSNLTN